MSTTLYSACTSMDTIMGTLQLDQQRIDVHGAHDVLTGRCLLIFFHVDSF